MEVGRSMEVGQTEISIIIFSRNINLFSSMKQTYERSSITGPTSVFTYYQDCIFLDHIIKVKLN